MNTSFDVRYPWGSRYMEGLMRALDIQGVHLIEDPRCAGSDQWGLFVARDEQALNGLADRIEAIVQEAPVDEYDEVDWEVVDRGVEAELSARGAILINTDWKHLEDEEHAEALAGIGLALERLEGKDGPTFVLSGGEADFEFRADGPTDIASELCALMGDRRSRNRALDALVRSEQGAAIARVVLEDAVSGGQLADLAELGRRWGLRKAEHVFELALGALAALPEDERSALRSLDATALESLPSSVGDLPGLQVLSSAGERFWSSSIQLPSHWRHRPRELRLHHRKVMPVPSDLFVEDDRSPVEFVDLLGSQVWLPRALWESNTLRTMRVEVSDLPRQDYSGFGSDLAFTPQGLKGLEQLHLGGDYDELPAWIGGLPRLRRLTLSSPNLKRLPDELGQLAQLEVLDIGGCTALESVPDSLLDCGRLRAVRLVGRVVESEMDCAFDSVRWSELPRGIAEHSGLELVIVDASLATRLHASLRGLIGRGVQVFSFPDAHPSLDGLLRKHLDKDPTADARPQVNQDIEMLLEFAAMASMFGEL